MVEDAEAQERHQPFPDGEGNGQSSNTSFSRLNSQQQQQQQQHNGDAATNDDGGGDSVNEDDHAGTPNEDNSNNMNTNKYRLSAHLWNSEIRPVWRFGLPIYLIATLGLLLASDVGSGVTVKTQTVPDPEFAAFFSSQVINILEFSVFTSVKELWNAKSYALTIFIVIMSISWPYIKLLLTLYAWVTPCSNPVRRERLLVMIDGLGKWSFVDLIVFIQIVVVFRATIPIGAGNLQVWIVPEWGLFGFVTATMLSLLGTHAALFHHRQIMFKSKKEETNNIDDDSDHIAQTNNGRGVAEVMESPPVHASGDDDNNTGNNNNNNIAATTNKVSLQTLSAMGLGRAWMLTILLLAGHGLYMVGCFLKVFEITSTQQLQRITVQEYSMADIGTGLNGSFLDGDEGRERYMAFVWFLLGFVMPSISAALFLVLLWLPMSTRAKLTSLFFAAEIAFSWSCAEVYLVSTLFSVQEMPKFGDGLVDVGCAQCYVIESKLYIVPILVWSVGVALSLGATIWISVIAHKVFYGDKQ